MNAGEKLPPLFGGVCVSALNAYLVPVLETVLSGGHEVKGIFAPLSKKYSFISQIFLYW